RGARCLNPRPEAVADQAFTAGPEFFDARDLVQVKYEMVRRVRAEGQPVTAAAAAFGFSRPSYYQAAAAVDAGGLAALVPARPGPRRAHKLTAEVIAFARGLREQVLGGQPGGWRLGLGVLHNRGVAAWLAAWDGLPAPAPPRPPGPPARPAPGGGEQLVAALAAMALSCLAARG